jgi:hypothetical protein
MENAQAFAYNPGLAVSKRVGWVERKPINFPRENMMGFANPTDFATFNPTPGRVTRLRLVSFGWLVSNKSRAQIGSSRQDKFMKIEIEYCGQ